MHANCIAKKNLMATLKIIIDTRTIKNDSSSPVYLRLIHHRKTINIKIGLYINAMHWNKKLQNVKHSHPNSKRWNITLTDKRLRAEKVLLDVENDINNISADCLRDLNEELIRSLLDNCISTNEEIFSKKWKNGFEYKWPIERFCAV